MLLPKANHDLRAWAVLIPVLALSLLWTILGKLLPGNSLQVEMLRMVFDSLSFALAVVLLSLHTPRHSGIRLFFSSAVILLVMGALAYLSLWGATFSQTTAGVAVLSAMLSATTLGGYTIAVRRCRRKYSKARFVIWLAVGCIITSMAAMISAGIISALVSRGIGISILFLLLAICIYGVVFGGIVFIINVPYVILALSNGLFRERLYACLRIQSPQAREIPTQEDSPPQGPAAS